jgi:hypothetical protein
VATAPFDAHWLSRSQAAIVLEVSERYVRKLESYGQLHPSFQQQGKRAIAVLARTEVAALAKRRAARGLGMQREARERHVDDEKAAAVFAMFVQGRPFDEIVCVARVHPTRVRELWREYQTPLGQPSPAEVDRAQAQLEKALAAFDDTDVALTPKGRR